jgi:hypothetical protein
MVPNCYFSCKSEPLTHIIDGFYTGQVYAADLFQIGVRNAVGEDIVTIQVDTVLGLIRLYSNDPRISLFKNSRTLICNLQSMGLLPRLTMPTCAQPFAECGTGTFIGELTGADFIDFGWLLLSPDTDETNFQVEVDLVCQSIRIYAIGENGTHLLHGYAFDDVDAIDTLQEEGLLPK